MRLSWPITCGLVLVALVSRPILCQDTGTRVDSNDQLSRVKNLTFISPQNPNIRVNVDQKFLYLGEVPFTLDNVVRGSRYIFVLSPTSEKHIERMFIIQQEGFLPSSNDTYKYAIKYAITNPAKLGTFDYQHSVIMDDSQVRIREEPGKEADLTERFLRSHGYVLEPELVMSRFARPADAERKHEIIFFCFENLSSYGHRLRDFPEGSNSPDKQTIKQQVDDHCRNTFVVND